MQHALISPEYQNHYDLGEVVGIGMATQDSYAADAKLRAFLYNKTTRCFNYNQ